jgi:ATP-binding cassette subfamily B protein
MMKYLKPYWIIALLAPMLMLLEVVMDLLQPMLMARIIDLGVKSGDVGFILTSGLGMLGIALIGAAGGLGCVALSNIAAQNFAADLRLEIFKKVQSYSFSEINKFKTGSLITRLTNDVAQVQMVVAMMMRLMVRAPLLFFGGLTMAFAINARMALVLVATVPLLAIVLAILIKKGFALFGLAQIKLDRVNVVLQENLAGIRVVKAFDRAEYEQERFDKVIYDLMDNMIKVAKVSSFAMPVVILIMNIGVIAVIWVGGIELSLGYMEIGEIMAFITYSGQILFSMAMMAMVLLFVSRGKASADRIIEVLDVEPSIKDDTGNDTYIPKDSSIEFIDVSLGYGGENQTMVLKDISFNIYPGETVAILGTTGSGKSSLISLIPRLYDATKGMVLLGGMNVKKIPLNVIRAMIGMVLQETIIISGTIEDNIRFGKEEATEEQVIQAAKTAQIHDFIASLPDGYKTSLGQRGVNLSGGQKQRIDIARALVKKPAVLVLDDSTSAVDAETEWNIHNAIKHHTKNTTCIIVAQRIASIMDADNILLLEEGKIAAQGTHKYLLANSPVYLELYRSQTEEEAS